MVISDLVPAILSKLGGISDSTSQARAIEWVAAVCRDLSMDFPLSLCEDTGPIFALTPGVGSYPISSFVNSTDTIARPIDFTLWLNTGASSGAKITLKYRTPSVVKAIQISNSIPVFWSRVGTNLIFGMLPDKAYNAQLTYQKLHPFSAIPAASDTVLFEDDFREILIYAAAEKGADELRMLDYSQMYHQKLYGAPHQNDGSSAHLGLIIEKKNQYARLGLLNERQMIPVVMSVQG